MNFTFTSLFLANHFKASPLFVSTQHSMFTLQRSNFYKLSSPIIFSSFKTNIIISDFRVKSSLAPILSSYIRNCPKIDIDTFDGHWYFVGSCVYMAYGSIENSTTTERSIIECVLGNITILNFRFANNAGSLAGCLYCVASILNISNCNIISCLSTSTSFGGGFAFFNSLTQSNIQLSNILNCASKNLYVSSIFINSSSITLSECVIVDGIDVAISNNTKSSILCQTCFSMRFVKINFTLNTQNQNSNTFLENYGALQIINSSDVGIVLTAFYKYQNKTIILYNSFLVVEQSCFPIPIENAIYVVDGNIQLNLVTTGITKDSICPYVNTKTELPEDVERYAIISASVFFVIYGIVFIGIVILMFCKFGSVEMQQYGSIHERTDDETSSAIVTD